MIKMLMIFASVDSYGIIFVPLKMNVTFQDTYGNIKKTKYNFVEIETKNCRQHVKVFEFFRSR